MLSQTVPEGAHRGSRIAPQQVTSKLSGLSRKRDTERERENVRLLNPPCIGC